MKTKSLFLAVVMTFSVKGNKILCEPATSIISVKETDKLSIYPNPVADFATISGLQGDETLHFYTISGQLLFPRKATGKMENIPVSHLPAGVYFVKTSNGQTFKWMKK